MQNEFENMKYTFEGDKEVTLSDAKSTEIKKLGVVVRFTYAQVEEQERMLNKMMREVTAQEKYEAATMVNLETNHPFLKNLTLEDLFTAKMYYEATMKVGACRPKMDQIKKQLEEYATEKSEMIKQLPILAEVVDESKELVAEAPAEVPKVEAPAEVVPETPVAPVAAEVSADTAAPASEGIPSPAEFLPGAVDENPDKGPDAENLK